MLPANFTFGPTAPVALGIDRIQAAPGRHAAMAAALGVPTEGRGEADILADLGPAFDRFIRSTGLALSLTKDGLGKAATRRLAETMLAPEDKAMRVPIAGPSRRPMPMASLRPC
jgi:hypothetical protein